MLVLHTTCLWEFWKSEGIRSEMFLETLSEAPKETSEEILWEALGDNPGELLDEL